MTVYPISKLTPERVSNMVYQYGSERIIVNGSADWGVSDPLSLVKVVNYMQEHGHSEETIQNLVFNNAMAFYRHSENWTPNFDMTPVEPHTPGPARSSLLLCLRTRSERLLRSREGSRIATRTSDSVQAYFDRYPRIALVHAPRIVAGGERAKNGWECVRGIMADIGGGLGARPCLAKVIFDWVPEDLVLSVARATVEAFRRHGDRRKRAHARLKVVVDKMGAKMFGEVLMDIMKDAGVEGLDRIEPAASPVPNIGKALLNGQEVLPQKQDGLRIVRVLIPRSKLKTGLSRTLIRLADELGGGKIMLTNRQNVELHDVPKANVPQLLDQLHEAGLRTEGHEYFPDMDYVDLQPMQSVDLSQRDLPTEVETGFSRETAPDEAQRCYQHSESFSANSSTGPRLRFMKDKKFFYKESIYPIRGRFWDAPSTVAATAWS